MKIKINSATRKVFQINIPELQKAIKETTEFMKSKGHPIKFNHDSNIGNHKFVSTRVLAYRIDPDVPPVEQKDINKALEKIGNKSGVEIKQTGRDQLFITFDSMIVF